MTTPKRHVIWEPQPPTASLSWVRSRLAPSRVALGGVTHALCSSNAVNAIRQLVTSPLKNFDRLVCTSEAVAHTARTLIDHWANVVGKAGDPEQIQLETIPLGVDCQRHRPASPAERDEVRRELLIQEAADVVLFVGRLSHHAKSNPLPLFAACQRAASVTGRPVVLVLAGWYASDVVKQAFESEAARVAPLVTLIHVNAMDIKWRDRIWAVADLFVSLADSVQETFGLTVVEAMARGIAVVASDWNGYRETIQHERSGLLVPTTMVVGAGERALIAMHEDRLSYDHFLAAVGQSVNVSTLATCNAIEQLLSFPSRRAELAEAGKRRVQEFSWDKIIARYERLWGEQDRLMGLQGTASRFHAGVTLSATSVPVVPTVHELFQYYPSRWITADSGLIVGDNLLGDFGQIKESPLANHSEQWREGSDSIFGLLNTAESLQPNPFTISQLTDNRTGKTQSIVASSVDCELSDTIGWAMKFDLLKCPDLNGQGEQQTLRVVSREPGGLTFSTTCMGRLSHLKQTLPRMVAQPGCHVVVVDYNCPERSGCWVRENYSPREVTVIRIPNREYFNMVEAKNAGIMAAATEWVCLIDADVLVAENFAAKIWPRLSAQRFLRRVSATEGVGGTFIARREALLQVGLHDPEFREWGEEDEDLLDALRFIGHQPGAIPEELLEHLNHDDGLRAMNYATDDLRVSHLANRVYRAAKWDIAKIDGCVPNAVARRGLYELIHSQIVAAVAERGSATITVPLGEQRWRRLSANATRKLTYKVEIQKDF